MMKDLSRYGNSGSINGTTSIKGRVGMAKNFNGTSDSINTLNSPYLNPTGVFTISAWFKVDSIGPNTAYMILGKGDWNFANSYSLSIYLNYLRCSIGQPWNQGANYAISNIKAGQWYSATCSVDSTGQKLFVNGVQVASSPNISTFNTDSNYFTIGSLLGFAVFLNGSVDEVRIYNRAFSPTEISDFYNATR